MGGEPPGGLNAEKWVRSRLFSPVLRFRPPRGAVHASGGTAGWDRHTGDDLVGFSRVWSGGYSTWPRGPQS